jgi:hypothetical protein
MLAGVAALSIITLVPAEVPNHGVAKEAEAKRIGDLVAKLGSREFLEREEATKALLGAGAPALEYLQKAADCSDAEVRRRAGQIIARIEKDIDTARLLKPKRIHLIYHNTPISEAVADFAKLSGCPLHLDGDRVRLASRKITLDTGDVTLWEALDQFCRAAGLREQHGPHPANPSTQAVNHENVHLREMLAMQRRGIAIPPPRVEPGRVILVEGQESQPISQFGGVRMRILPSTIHNSGHANSSEEVVLALEVSPEPGIDWRGVLEARVEKAVDSTGREVKQVLATPVSNNESVNDRTAMGFKVVGNNAVVWNNVVVNNAVVWDVDFDNHFFTGQPPGEIPIRLKLNEREIKPLHEIRGVVFAQVQSPLEPIIHADKILQAEGKTFKGPDGSFLKVDKAKQVDNGQITVRATLRAPSTGEDALAMMQGAIFVRRFNRRMAFMAQQEGETKAVERFALQDAKGRNFQLVTSEVSAQFNGLEVTQDFRLLYQSKQGLEEPTQLVYSGQRIVTVEIPFVFKDVPVSH